VAHTTKINTYKHIQLQKRRRTDSVIIIISFNNKKISKAKIVVPHLKIHRAGIRAVASQFNEIFAPKFHFPLALPVNSRSAPSLSLSKTQNLSLFISLTLSFFISISKLFSSLSLSLSKKDNNLRQTLLPYSLFFFFIILKHQFFFLKNQSFQQPFEFLSLKIQSFHNFLKPHFDSL